MSKVLTICFIMSLTASLKGQYIDEMQYIKNKGVKLKEEFIKKPRHLKPIIEEKNDEELTSLFKKYRRTHFIYQTVARIRDFGMFYGVLDVYVNPRIQPIPLAIGLGGIGGAALLRLPTNNALKELVDQYNDLVLIERIQQEKQLSTRDN